MPEFKVNTQVNSKGIAITVKIFIIYLFISVFL